MRALLWPDAGVSDLASEVPGMLENPETPVWVAQRDGGGLCGFAEASIRAFADGIEDAPCAFLEGWWVDVDARGSGIGRLLVEAVQLWARERGFTELGSDTELENQVGQRAHLALGFEERSRNIYYAKKL
jgi:aminoglycoside 6'-N-acetyltransferase I